MENEFVRGVQHDFQFLVNEFGFELLRSTGSPRDEQWEGSVQYATKTTLVNIDCARGGSPSVSIGRTKDDGKFLLSLQVIYEYRIMTIEEKRIVLSQAEHREVSRIMHEKQLSHLIPDSKNALDRNLLVLKALSDCIQKYALRFLRADFSEWLPIWEYHVEKLIAENARRGRPNSVPVVVTNEIGKPQVVGKEPFLKKSRDYLQTLRDEKAN